MSANSTLCVMTKPSGSVGIPPSLMTSTANIPQETVDEIIEHAEKDPSTLCSLCLVSKSFLPRARQILYRDINICSSDHDAPVYSGWTISDERAVKFFETLITHNDALAGHIQRLYHHHDDFSPYYPGYWHLAKQSLRLMVNLQSLILTDTPPSIIDFFEGCTFRLRVFECDISCDDIETRRELTRFFASQPDIRSLDIRGYTRPDESFSGPHLPRLEALIGDSCTIENLLPHQPLVVKLTWILHLQDIVLSPPKPHRIASSLLNIHHFTLGGFFYRPDIGLFIPHLPSVRVLRLVGESYQLPLADELALIPDLPKLQILIWSGGFPPVDWSRFTNRTDKRNQYVFVKRLFERTKFLEKVYIDTPPSMIGTDVPPRPKFDSPYYLCWERKRPEPTVVGFQDAVVVHNVVSWYQ